MADDFTDLVLFPHCDVHAVLDGAKPLTLKVFRRRRHESNPRRYRLDPNPVTDAVYEFMAPHRDPGKRFDGLPTVDPATGQVTATEPGVYLFQIRAGDDYIVGRLQVHNRIMNWWFGNNSITTALDPEIYHAQPTLYARFINEPTGTDLVGDITGHGYVALTPDHPDTVVVNEHGRLRGVAVTDPDGVHHPVSITGNYRDMVRSLAVRVVDYGKVRTDLDASLRNNVSQSSELQNILFLPEGFTDAEKTKFYEFAYRATDLIFDNATPRHEPYGLLREHFNVFNSFVPSEENGVTCGFRVTDRATGRVPTGLAIPFDMRVNSKKPKLYTMAALVARVGLPQRNEAREHLAELWNRQGLPDFDPTRVDGETVDAWKGLQCTGMLHVRDTVFGLVLGGRFADRASGKSTATNPAVVKPALDRSSEAMTRFIGRVYEFYTTALNRHLGFDPRRHPPELYANSRRPNPDNSVLRLAAGLKFKGESGTLYDIGKAWFFDDSVFQRSRGLVGLIVYDYLSGGTNMNGLTIAAQTVASKNRVVYEYGGPSDGIDPQRMFRKIPKFAEEPDGLADTIAHEFGHSFNLGDEYEEFDGDAPEYDLPWDNVTLYSSIRSNSPPPRAIDPAKVEWLKLPAILISSTLSADSQERNNGIEVNVGALDIGAWIFAQLRQFPVRLQNFDPRPNGRQFPFPTTPQQQLNGLVVVDNDVTRGTIVLGGSALPPRPFPTFKKGSAVFVPMQDGAGKEIPVVRKSVLKFLQEHRTPLNKNREHFHFSEEADVPVRIPGQRKPAQPSTMIGVFEGADHFAGAAYRPAGACKMRNSSARDDYSAFCFVCKWLIVNRIDPGFHALVRGMFYPEHNHD
nr:M64 family metallopeptidase [Actinomadura rubrisoli]